MSYISQYSFVSTLLRHRVQRVNSRCPVPVFMQVQTATMTDGLMVVHVGRARMLLVGMSHQHNSC